MHCSAKGSNFFSNGCSVKKQRRNEGVAVTERTSRVWTRMTQHPAYSRPVVSWWARRETSSVNSNYRYPTPTTPGPVGPHERNAIYVLQVLIALHGCDRSASFAAGHEFVDTSSAEGPSRRGCLVDAGIIDGSPDVDRPSLDTHLLATVRVD